MILMDGIRIGETFARNQEFLVRGFGGGSLMTWAAISSFGRLALVFVEGRMNSNAYLAMLEANLIPFLRKYRRIQFKFQQDNASIHVSSAYKQWFTAKKIDLLDWLAKSPDLNIIENVWSILARDVYDNSRQFDSVSQLRTAIEEAWGRLSVERLKKLYDSCHRRMISVIQLNGNTTCY